VLHLHRAERADALVEVLGTLLADPPRNPFAPEVVAVPTRGMERWLTQRMSTRLGASAGRSDGICANVEFPFPHRLVGDAVATASGIDPSEDPWRPERSVWPLLEVVDAHLGEPWLGTLSAHLGDTADPLRRARRFATVRHLADLFDRYALHRPEMVLDWVGGEDTDGSGRALAPTVRWQAELWRRLRDRVGQAGPAENLAGACAILEGEPALLDLPDRLSLFGLTRLPAAHVRVLRALAAGRDVHVFLLHPSPALWERVAQATAERPPFIRRQDDVTATLPANPLLTSWGRDARELQLVLAPADDHVDHHHPAEQGDDTLLSRIQADVRADRSPPGAPLPGRADGRLALATDDRSVEIHACHGRARQVEVIRDAILHLLQNDLSLEPRDVIVMCPDIETFAPLIHATFGAGEVVDEDEELDPLPADVRPPDLRVRLADRSLRQTNPVLGVVAQLVDLAEQRLTASQVLDLADREPVRRRFRFDDDDLARLEDWVSESGIRWGLDAAHREPFKLDKVRAGTWRAGLDRVLVGVAMTEEERRLFAGVLPLDDVESGAIDLAGRFGEFVDRLHAAVDAFAAPKTIDAWATAVADAADALTTTSQRDAWQRAELERLLDDVVGEATVAGAADGTELALAEVRALLAERLQGRPTRANFRTGHLTVCTLMPMRSVPHRVVALLGLDDGVFPRKSVRDGDDLILDDPHVGDRDSRSEDRQLLLDALLAATDRLIVTYTGNDERTNAERPPAVPIGELLDVVDRTAYGANGAALDQVLTRHPLQPFDPRNFTPGALGGKLSRSFDRAALEGARALAGPRAPLEPFLSAPLPADPATLVEVEDLVAFVSHPVRAFLRQRLGISARDYSDELVDALPVQLDHLETWGVGDRLVAASLDGSGFRTAYQAEIARGGLPPGLLGWRVIEEVRPTVEGVVAAALGTVGDQAPASADVRVALPGGRGITGTVPGVVGDVLRTVMYSRVGPKHRLAAWVRLLALTAAHPDRPFEAVTIGRAARGTGVAVVSVPPLGDDAASRRTVAVEQLAALVDLFDRGMSEPAPLYCKASAAYAVDAAAGRDGTGSARKAWESEFRFDKEDREPEHLLVLDGQQTIASLLETPARADEQGPSWDSGEPSRVGRWALRLWTPLLSREQGAGR